MKILEIRDEFIKFETKDNYKVSEFVQVCADDCEYIAEVVQVVPVGIINKVIVKVLYLDDENLTQFSNVSILNVISIEHVLPDIVDKILVKNGVSIYLGKYTDGEKNIAINKKDFEHMLCVLETSSQNQLFISNILKQYEKHNDRMIVVDATGMIEGEKYVAGKDFKLALNADMLQFIYQDCLGNITRDSKLVIKDIFRDLAEYAAQVPFLPFQTLKTIIDTMVEKEHVFKLLALKNKLKDFDKSGCLASSVEEFEKINDILSRSNIVIDLSKLDDAFKNKYLQVIYSILEKQEEKPFVLFETTDSINKASLKLLLKDTSVKTSFVANPGYKYLKEIKGLFENCLLENSLNIKTIYSDLKPLFSSMNKNECLFTGDVTKQVPFVVNITECTDDCIEQLVEVASESTKVDLEQTTDEINGEIIDETIDETTNEAVLTTVNVGIDNSTVDEINKKSEDLIKQVSEEIGQNTTIELSNLFSNEESLSDAAFHTKVDSTINEEASNEGTELSEAPENDSVEETNEIIEAEIVENSEEVPEDNLDAELDVTEQTQEQTEIDDSHIEDDAQNIEEESSDETIDISVETENEATDLETQETVEETDLLDEPVDDAEVQDEIEAQDEEEVQGEEEIIDDGVDEVVLDGDLSDFEELMIETDSIDDKTTDDVEDETAQLDTEEIENAEAEQLGITSEENIDISDENADISEDSSESLSVEVPEADDVITLATEDDLGAFEELELSELKEDDTLVEMDAPLSEEDLNQEIVDDVDKVFTTMKDDTITDSDLDFIDELNDDTLVDDKADSVAFEDTSNIDEELIETNGEIEELPEYSELDDISDTDDVESLQEEIEDFEPKQAEHTDEALQTKSSTTSKVPIYDAEIPQEDVVNSDTVEQGDTVRHAKFGIGVVEKMIKYGTKTLCSINFEDNGRKLVDPTLTEIKKV